MTIPRYLLLLPVLAAVLTVAPIARADDEAGRILVKVRQLDLLNQIVPVLMTADQIKKLLPAIEKSRAAEQVIQKDELAAMKKLEARVDSAIKEAKEKSLVPSREFQAEVIATFQLFTKNRAAMISEQNDLVLKAVEESLDQGQIKAEPTRSLSLQPTQRSRLTAKSSGGGSGSSSWTPSPMTCWSNCPRRRSHYRPKSRYERQMRCPPFGGRGHWMCATD